MTSEVLTIKQVAEIIGLGVGTIYNRLSQGWFLPLPVSRSPHRWSRADIDRYLRGEFREPTEKLRAKVKKASADRDRRR